MSSKTAPTRLHVAMLNSLRAIEMLGGQKLLCTELQGQYSRNIETQRWDTHSVCLRDRLHTLVEMYSVGWKAKGDGEAKTVGEILGDLANDGCPDVFLKSLTIIRPWSEYSEYLMENRGTYRKFIFHPHPFKPSVFNRLKGTMPSLKLYARMKELRKILSTDLDEETKKRWRDILLINQPHKSLSNQDIRQLWANEGSAMLLKETRGSFTLMEIGESKEA